MFRIVLRTPKTALLAAASGDASRKQIDHIATLPFRGELSFHGDEWPSAFKTLGNNPKEIAQAIHDNVNTDKFYAQLDKYTDSVWNHLEMLPESERAYRTFAWDAANLDGHRGFYAGYVEMEDAAKLFESTAISRHMIQSFPQGALIIDPEWLKKIEEKEPAQRLDFIKENRDEIEKASEHYLSQSEELKGCGALLGSESLVSITNVHRQVNNGRLTQTMTVATLVPHALDGVNLWISSFDPKFPEGVLFSNVLIGKHPVPWVMDFLNNKLGKRLMATGWRTVALSVEAERRKMSLDELIAEKIKIEADQGTKAGVISPRELQLNRTAFQMADRLSPPPAWFRTKFGPTIDTQKQSLVVEAQNVRPLLAHLTLGEALPTALHDSFKFEEVAGGIYFEDIRISPESLVTFTRNGLTPDVEAVEGTVRESVAQVMDKSTIKVIRKVSDDIQKPIIKDLATEHHSRGGILKALRQDTLCTIMFQAKLQERLAAYLAGVVQNSLSSALDKPSPKTLDKASNVLISAVLGSLYVTGGIYELLAEDIIIKDTQGQVPDKKDIDKQLDEVNKTIRTTQEELKKAGDVSSGAVGKENSDHIIKLQTQVDEESKKQEDLKQAQKEAKTDKPELVEQGLEKKESELAEHIRHGRGSR